MGLIMTQTGAIYLGTEQFLTLAGVLLLCGGLLIFLIKHQFNEMTNGIAQNTEKLGAVKADLQAGIQKNNDKINERIDHLEEKTGQEISILRQEVNDIKGDFALTFVQREDFYRYMNSMEEKVKDTNSKVDRILMLMTDRRNENGT